ncbi:hypothetical protein [Microbacterium sp. ZKA21]|uniref:hypothetical protein n=1 Tax=Microbacterium sp. ZKA21 TaxID=3381694 RepID=UPI003D1BD461
MSHRRPLPGILHQNAIRVSEAAAFGITRSRLRSSDVDTPFRGVRSSGLDLDRDVVARCLAVAVLMDEADLFSHSTVLALWRAPLPAGLGLPSSTIHIGTIGSTRMRRAGVTGHRLPVGVPSAFTPDGLRAVAPASAWCQLAGQALPGHPITLIDLVSVGDFLVTGRRAVGGFRHPPICTIDDLRAAVAGHGRGRGARMLARAVELVRVGPASAKETELRLVVLEAGLPEPVIGHRIRTRLGLLTPDLAFPAHRVLLEYEGDQHRRNRTQWRGDFERVRAFQEAGWTVIRVNADDLSDPARRAALLDQVRVLLASRGQFSTV